jgi:hypothetical protein
VPAEPVLPAAAVAPVPALAPVPATGADHVPAVDFAEVPAVPRLPEPAVPLAALVPAAGGRYGTSGEEFSGCAPQPVIPNAKSAAVSVIPSTSRFS